MPNKRSDPYSYAGKNAIGSGKVPIGHFRKETLKIGSDANTRPEQKKYADARGVQTKKGGQ